MSAAYNLPALSPLYIDEPHLVSYPSLKGDHSQCLNLILFMPCLSPHSFKNHLNACNGYIMSLEAKNNIKLIYKVYKNIKSKVYKINT